MRIYAGSAAFLTCALMTSCMPADQSPSPIGTLEPSITESSHLPSADPNNVACTLLTARERSEMAGYALDDPVPLRATPGTEECMWVHSLREPARSAIRVTALSISLGRRQLVPQIRAAAMRPTTGKALRAKLNARLADLLTDPDALPANEVCEVHIMLAEAYGAVSSDQQVYYGTIGAMPAAFGVACDGGILATVGYGEYGIRQSLALNRAVIRLVEAASKRAAEALAPADDGDEPGSEPDADAEDSDIEPAAEPDAGDEEQEDS